MSFIRMGQSGQYVSIPGGSNHYIYGNGDTISGWTPAEFAALIGGVVDEIPWDGESDLILFAFEEHFGGWDPEYRGGITRPERAEIFCQCVDSRIDDLELTPDLHQAVRSWVDEFDAFRACEYCGDEFVPYIYNDDTTYVCDDDECQLRNAADVNGVSVEVQRRSERIQDHLVDYVGFDEAFDESWEYIESHVEDDC